VEVVYEVIPLINILIILLLLFVGVVAGHFFAKQENRMIKNFVIFVIIIVILIFAPLIVNWISYGRIGYPNESPFSNFFGVLILVMGFMGTFLKKK